MPASVRAESTTPCFPTESRYASPSASGPVYCERATPASVPNHCEKCRFAHSAADASPHSTEIGTEPSSATYDKSSIFTCRGPGHIIGASPESPNAHQTEHRLARNATPRALLGLAHHPWFAAHDYFSESANARTHANQLSAVGNTPMPRHAAAA